MKHLDSPSSHQKQYKLAIFLSGGGSNAQKIIEYFEEHGQIQVSLVVSNRSKAGGLDIARDNAIPTLVINKADLQEGAKLVQTLEENSITHVILAGFLMKIPPYLISMYPEKILNLHPSLLPKYGGKGMYGKHVHKAVKDAQEKESGMTIHIVSAKYDEGPIIFQARCPISEKDSIDDIARKVQCLEHEHYSTTIENHILNTSEKDLAALSSTEETQQ